ncbi:MAG: hypothetical protein MJ225_03040 [Bacilli bacterium]|nr:hypothetical protein [Bacilli bacterium]
MKKIFKSIDKILAGGILTIVALVLAFVFWVEPDSNKSLPLWSLVLVVLGFLFLILLVYVFTCYFTEKRLMHSKFSLIRTITKDSGDGEIRIIQDYSDYLSQDCLVTIFFQETDEDIEKPIGIGVVESIRTTSNFTQIRIIKFLVHSIYNIEVSQYLYSNTKKIRNCLSVKPNINVDFITIREEFTDEKGNKSNKS